MGAVTGTQLRDLIQRGLDAKSWSLKDLERATKRIDPTGRGVAYSSLAAWMHPRGGASMPRPENLDVVARALGLSPDDVHAAARAAAGYREETALMDPDLQVFAADYEKLSPEARARLMRIVRNVMSDPDLFPRQGRNGGGRGR